MNEIRRDVFVTRNTIKEPIAYVQATNTIPIIFTFRDWTIPTGAVAKVYVTKPSSKGTYDIARIEGNTVIVEPKDQTFAEAGISTLQIQIVEGEKTLVSFAVPVNVEKNNVAGDVPESKNQSNFIDEYLTDIKGAIDKAEDITTDAEAIVEDINKKLENGEFASSIAIGTVRTGQDGEPASVTNSGTKKDAILDMTIPRGKTGTVGKIETSTAENHLLYTVESAAILDELKGKTVQENTTGAQLFDASKILGNQVNGITFKNNLDGSFTISGTATKDAKTILISIDLPAGDYILNSNHKNVIFTYYYVTADGVTQYVNNNKFTVDGTEKERKIYLEVRNGITINDVIYPMLNAGTTLKMFEKYTGGKPSPNPDYPQLIKGIGSRGWFDGVLLQGYYAKGDGVYKISKDSVCSKNMIKVSSGDKVNIKYEIPIREIRMIIYDINGNFLGVHEIGDAKELVHTFQSNEAFFNFHMASVGQINPQTAKHISVLKNGKYCAWIRSIDELYFDGELLQGYYATSNGVIDLNYAKAVSSRNPIPCKKGDIIKLIYDLPNVYWLNIVQYDSSGKYVVGNEITSKGNMLEVEILSDKTNYCHIGVQDSITQTITPQTAKRITVLKNGRGNKESNIQIELDEPLWSESKICKVDGKYGVYQKYKEIVLDGSADESWTLYEQSAEQPVLHVYNKFDNVKKIFQTSLCDTFKNVNEAWDIQEYGLYSDYQWSNNKYFSAPNSAITTLGQFKTWLQSNPVTVVYELETPQFVPFPDSAQAQFYSLRTYDQQTSVFLVDELQTEFTIDYASNSTGDYVLSGYSKAQTMESINADPFEIGLASDTKDGLMSKAEFTKLKGIESGAQKNPNLSNYYSTTNKPTKIDVGLPLADNTADANKSVMQSKILGYGSGLTVETYGGNEINFGTQGENISDYIYFSYRDFKGRPKIKTFIFGNHQDLATIKFNQGIGNVDSADKLKTPRTINGVSFDGTKNIEIPVLQKQYLIVVPKDKLITNVFYDNGVVSAMLPVDIPKALGIATSTYSDWRTIVQVDAYHLMFGTPDQYNEQKVNLACGEVVQIGTDLASGFSIAEKMDKSGMLELTLKVGSSMDSSMANYKSQVGDLYVVVTMMDGYDIKTLT